MSTQPRHEQLIDAGWIYDAQSDRYRAPGSASDGTARMFDQAAAWLAHETGTTPMPPKSKSSESPKRTPPTDPRIKEPE
jgi:hypothetical protein